MATCAISQTPAATLVGGLGSPVLWERLHHHCHDPQFDIPLMERLTEAVLANADCPAAEHLRSTESTEACQALLPILRCLRLLHLCGFVHSDVEVVVAHTMVYIEECLPQLLGCSNKVMELQELSHIVCVLLFLAHSYASDKNCPLRIWQKHAFVHYCGIQTLNAAVLRLMELLGYVLRVEPEDLEVRLSYIRGTS